MSYKLFELLSQRQKRNVINRARERDIHEESEINIFFEENSFHSNRNSPVDQQSGNHVNTADVEFDNGFPIENGLDVLQLLDPTQNNDENIVLIGEQVDDQLIPNQLMVANQNQLVNNIIDDGDNEASTDEERNGENDNVIEDEDYDDPLYMNAELTYRDSMLLILSLFLKHNLTMACVEDIIKMVQSHCPQRHLKPNSIYRFKKFCGIENGNDYTKHFYCPECYNELRDELSVCATCPYRKAEYFLEISVVSQLKEMYRRPGFYNKLQHPRERVNHPNIISDIYDGSLYKQWVANGFLADQHNISLCWYTDGIPPYESAKISLWPIVLCINELPFNERKKKENTLLLGLWCGKKKPKFNLFFNKVKSEILQLWRGVPIYLPDNERITVRGVLLTGTCDLPAKSDCLNFTQFNGRYGCPVCFIPGERIFTGPRSSLQTYPYTRAITERTSNVCIDIANTVTVGEPKFGIKGFAVISQLMPDFLAGMAIDRMHGLDAGVLKKLLILILTGAHSTYPFSLRNQIDIINSRLKNIKPPKFVHRLPRDVSDLVHWKASELKMFLFYYAVPVFENVMDEVYFKHFLKLIVAGSLLSQEKISHMELDVADNLLHQFVRDFENLYGQQFSTINIHQLLHLSSCVRRLGPLWAHSCYEFEDLNGKFLKTVHGTGHLQSQIVRTHTLIIRMTRQIQELPENDIKKFCMSRKRQVKIAEAIGIHTYSVGKYNVMDRILNCVRDGLRSIDITADQFLVFTYLRLLKNDKLYVAQMYSRRLHSLSSVVKYSLNGINYGNIICFVKLQCNQHIDCDCQPAHYAIIERIICDSAFTVTTDEFEVNTTGHIFKCHASNTLTAIPVDSIQTPCFYLNVEWQNYIAVPINDKELE